MTQRFTALVFISFLALSLAGYARAGCCQKYVAPVRRLLDLTVSTNNAACATSATAAACPSPFTGGFIQAATCAATGCISGSATMGSDPVLTGFDNVTFEFFGSAGSNYSVITSTALTVNMRLVEAGPLHIRHQEGEGTFVSSLAVLLPSLELIVDASEAGAMTFTLNGIEMDTASPLAAANNTISYDPYAPDMGQVITVTHDPFRFTIVAVKQFTDDISGYNRGHLDFSVDLTGPVELPITGALGQTLYGSIKADDPSFAIPSLTFHKTIPEETISISRRLQASEGHLHFPLHARLAATYPMGAHA